MVRLLAVGAPGGRNIPVAVMQVVLHVVDFKMGIQEAIERRGARARRASLHRQVLSGDSGQAR
jgi:gamma-glutamyltranspeptidase